jgi:tetratricopeptide (TPR) repeat protein
MITLKSETYRIVTRSCFIAITTVVVTLISLSAVAQNTQSPKNTFEKANQAFHQSEYTLAIELYQKIIDKGIHSADLYYNIGNCYFRQNDFAMAIVNYERGLRIRPNDPDINYNLKLTNTFIKDEIIQVQPFFLMEWWKTAVSLLAPAWWLTLHILSFLMLLVMVARFLTASTIRRRVAAFRSAWLALSLTLLLLVPAVKSYRNIHHANEAVIISDNTMIKSGPGLKNNTLGEYQSGTKVNITNQDAGWLEVRTPDGHVGWVAEENLVII